MDAVAPIYFFLLIILAAPTVQAQETPGDKRSPDRPYVERLPARFRYDEATRSFADAEKDATMAIEMVFIPGGKYLMGSPDGEIGHDKSESPEHEVKISPFWMSKCEVTWEWYYNWQLSYGRLSGEGARGLSREEIDVLKALPTPGVFYFDPEFNRGGKKFKRPIAGITQYGAEQFCRWLSARTGRTYRLPTEGEWEYAARAGTKSVWSFGNDPKKLEEYSWHEGKLDAGPQEIGTKKPNQWGLYDMYGNVGEWTLDGWSDDYRNITDQLAVDPWVARKKGTRWGVVRGGDWTSSPEDARSASRRKEDDTAAESFIDNFEWWDLTDDGRRVGFRIVSPVAKEKDGREISVPNQKNRPINRARD